MRQFLIFSAPPGVLVLPTRGRHRPGELPLSIGAPPPQPTSRRGSRRATAISSTPPPLTKKNWAHVLAVRTATTNACPVLPAHPNPSSVKSRLSPFLVLPAIDIFSMPYLFQSSGTNRDEQRLRETPACSRRTCVQSRLLVGPCRPTAAAPPWTERNPDRSEECVFIHNPGQERALLVPKRPSSSTTLRLPRVLQCRPAQEENGRLRVDRIPSMRLLDQFDTNVDHEPMTTAKST